MRDQPLGTAAFVPAIVWLGVGLSLAPVAPARSQQPRQTDRTPQGDEQLRSDVERLQNELDAAQQALAELTAETRDAAEWREATSAFHLAGYAAAGYTDRKNETGSFDFVTFNPVFHFQYRDRVLWEAEVEMEINGEGESEFNLEYSAIDFLLNDYMILSGGKFLSPLGQFRQNMHPAWVNKMPSAPPGFGHDGAVPESEIGVQLRGGVPFGEKRLNYALYVGNGPELEAEDGEIEAIATEGFTRDVDGKKVWGGRVGFLPFPQLEVGLSAAVGKTSVTKDGGADVAGDPIRDYDAFGVDAVYHWRQTELRAEYLRQKVGDAAASVAPSGDEWEAWYVQGAYKFAEGDWEAVLRYGDFGSPHAAEQQKQWAIGVDYLFSPSAMVKFGYEFNDNDVGAPVGENRWLVQVAYGY